MDADTYATMPETLGVREVHIGSWTLVTTLADAQEVSKHDLFDPYHARWQIELDLRSIKTVIRMDVLRCKSRRWCARRLLRNINLPIKHGAYGDGANEAATQTRTG